tara:strand:+ start:1042 stop:1413 length:372 start_codon:yes stop_codon:yes gene_type:complete
MSTLKADTIQSTGGGAVTLTKQSAAKTYVRFELVGTVSILGSLNISSVEDVATGAGRPNHTSNMSAADYALVGGTALNGNHAFSEHAAGASNITSRHRVTSRNESATLIDADMLCTTLFGGLA